MQRAPSTRGRRCHPRRGRARSATRSVADRLDAADDAGAAAERHDRDALVRAEPQHARDLSCALRIDDRVGRLLGVRRRACGPGRDSPCRRRAGRGTARSSRTRSAPTTRVEALAQLRRTGAARRSGPSRAAPARRGASPRRARARSCRERAPGQLDAVASGSPHPHHFIGCPASAHAVLSSPSADQRALEAVERLVELRARWRASA